MKIGVNLMLFGDVIDVSVQRQFTRIKELGYDGVEVPVFAPGKVDCQGIAKAASDAGLEVTCSAALPPNSRFYGDDEAAIEAAIDYLVQGIEAVACMGAKVWVGPFYKGVGDHDLSIPLAEQRVQAAETMRPFMKIAEAVGVVLGIEPLNRFETNFMNTAEQGIAFCQELDSPSASLLLDTFHMHIEEKSSPDAILAAQKQGKLAHFHCSENDRGIPGSGQVHWPEVAQAIKASGYDGWLVLETFNQDNLAIRKAAACWRSFYPTAEEYLQQGLAFVKKTFK
jgi:D-psicose/D-tagatose/L-ribulose 3-epimerase